MSGRHTGGKGRVDKAKLPRIAQAKEALRICQEGTLYGGAGEFSIQRDIEAAVRGTVHYSPEDDFGEAVEARPGKPLIEVVNETTLQGIWRLDAAGFKDSVCALNFASAKNPGGGFQTGAQAQEESLARASALYPCIVGAPGYAETRRDNNNALYHDYLSYSPDVPVFFNSDGQVARSPGDVKKVSFVSVAAPNKGAAPDNRKGEAAGILKQRVDKALCIMARRGHRGLVLGAFGCGVFKNDPAVVAQTFAGFLKGKYAGCFDRVSFSILSSRGENLGEFQEAFGLPAA
eukprot:TRINITY_DN20443_c0_g1_i1.p1 TRINITY_DN20443_c0_g1~~TRINITY_DN20443_c0_g1_i1.p1  ORF type:complete len:289 (+),score=80.24 TRINITY_DN20443_c0_g1_i1:107-973(+)